MRRLRVVVVVPILVAVVVFLSASAAVLIALHFGRDTILGRELDELLHLGDSYATAVRFYLDGARATMESTAPLPALTDALATVAQGADTAERTAALARARFRAALIAAHSRTFDEVMLLSPDGRVVLLEPPEREQVQARPDRRFAAWYRDVIAGGRTVISDLHLSPSSLEPTVVIATPVRDRSGRLVGIWAGALRLAELSRVGRAGDVRHPAYGFVTDRRGLVVAHQAAPRFVQHQTDFSEAPGVRRALAGERGVGRFVNPIERAEQLGAWVPLETTGWAVMYAEPVEAIAGPLRALTWKIVPLVVGMAALLGVAGLLVARRLVRPIEQLTQAAERLDTAVPQFAVSATAGSEVARLAQALNAMVAAISERDATLRQRTAELERLVGELESASRAKDQFLATLSHELRTPLNAVYGWARMLRSPSLDRPTTERAVAAIERNALAQAQLIDDLLDVSRIVTGKMRLDVTTVALDEVVQAALDTVRLAAEAKGVRLQVVLDPRSGPVKGDAERLQQVVWNLLVNGIKFTPRGGRVQVHLQRAASHAEIVVSDTGQGIPADVLPFVFERFRQADSGTTREHGGLGIGLALVRHLVELHGGTVHAHSDGEGKGAVFTVRLPLVAVEPARPEAARAPLSALPIAPSDLGATLKGVRVLVVDDDADSLDLIAAVLSQQGAVVEARSSAARALEAFEQWRPDVVLADIEKPGEDGYSLIRRIRALSPAGGKVPAAAITAYGRTEDRVRALSAGFTTYLPKPVDPDELAAVVLTLARQAS
jgi:signal transduction histidine kinase/ActR/RegA family two-component response regulator